MTKFYLANTPLILTDDNGTDYRVERGEVVELTDEQYAQVAAHVTPAGTPETTGQSETEITPTGQPETAQTASEPADSEPPATQPETATEPTEKPKRGKGDKAE